jgi:hypothetical protein
MKNIVLAMSVLALLGFCASVFAQIGEVREVKTYEVKKELKGLMCVKGVGNQNRCAVANQDANEGGYPWSLVKCKPGDDAVGNMAWSLKDNSPVQIFEAPPALVTGAQYYTLDVRLIRTCMKPSPK